METTKKLGFGMMRLPLTDPEDKKSVDIEKTKEMVDLFIQRGFTYFDTAWMYCAFQSECVVKEVLTDRYPRDSFTLADKLHAGYLTCPEDRDRIFAEQKRKTGVDYFDYYLLHSLNADLYEKLNQYDCFNWLKAKKEAGEVKEMGFSFHDSPEMLETILREHPEMDFVQLQINYLDWESQGVESRRCYEVARKYGKPIVVMEPVKGGTLANLPLEAESVLRNVNREASPASFAIRFAASLPGVRTVLSGMSSAEQVKDNTAYMERFVPLSDSEKEAVFRVADILKGVPAIPCTGCSYCTEGCPMHIAIPQYFSLFNAEKKTNGIPDKASVKTDFSDLEKESGKPGDCIGCGQCVAVCPQKLDIPALLQKVHGHFHPQK